MGVVQVYRWRRVAKRQAALKGKPAWQDRVPDSPEMRATWKIAAGTQKRFSRAFLEAMKGLAEDFDTPEFRAAWKSGSVQAVLNTIPFYNPGQETKAWERFLNRMGSAYLDVIQEAGADATKRLNEKFKTKLGFVVKAKAKAPPRVKAAPTAAELADREAKAQAVSVPVNPYAKQWIQDTALKKLKQNVTDSQKEVVRSIIQDGFSKGIRPESVLGQIKSNIGLTDRQLKAVNKRQALHESAGMSKDQAEAMAGKYRDQLLEYRAETIARTEMIAAQTEGRQEAWKLAQESGNLPPVQRRWEARAESKNPNAPCSDCMAMDQETADLGQPYQSETYGAVMGPPLHPDCVCTEILERKED